jgi:hypothetical protein
VVAVTDQHYGGVARQARRLLDENQRLLKERDQLAYDNTRLRQAARAEAKKHGVNIDDLRAWVTKREKLTIRDPSRKQGFAYAKKLLEVFDATTVRAIREIGNRQPNVGRRVSCEDESDPPWGWSDGEMREAERVRAEAKQ